MQHSLEDDVETHRVPALQKYGAIHRTTLPFCAWRHEAHHSMRIAARAPFVHFSNALSIEYEGAPVAFLHEIVSPVALERSLTEERALGSTIHR